MTQSELATRVGSILDELRVPYYLTGSFALSAHGHVRASHGVDFVVVLSEGAAVTLCARLEALGYVDEIAAVEAAQMGGQFNLIHVESGTKVDLWLPVPTPFGASAMARRMRVLLGGTDLWVASAEDVLLSKLQWHRQSGLERDWTDCRGLIRCQERRLDLGYLRGWAEELRLSADLRRALAEAGWTET
jgi:hypothetical protein